MTDVACIFCGSTKHARRAHDPRQLWLFPEMQAAPKNVIEMEPKQGTPMRALWDENRSLKQRIEELENRLAWKAGARGTAPQCLPGFNHSQTRLLRMLAVDGWINHDPHLRFRRLMPKIRAILGASVVITNRPNEGYAIQHKAHLDLLRQIVAGKISVLEPSQQKRAA